LPSARGDGAAEPQSDRHLRADPLQPAPVRQAWPQPPHPRGSHHGIRSASGARNIERSSPMTKRRARGDGGVHWDEQRQRFIASPTVGYDPTGKRIVRRGSGKTEAQARAKLKEVIRDYDDGLAIAPHNLTVAQVVTDWLSYALNGRSPATVDKWTCLC